MRIVLTNLSNQLFENSRLRLNDSARKMGITEITSWDFEVLKQTGFYRDNIGILNQPKGIGYWLWKPFIILESMKNLNEGDIVIYSDCGIEITDRLDTLISICSDKQPVLLFGNGNFTNSMWTKRDCFVLMECDNETYWKSPHCDAAFSMFRKSEQALQFLGEWLDYARDERILTDLENTCGKKNLPGFIEHRWDQSIMSLLAEKYRLSLYRMPTQFGNHYKIHRFRVDNEMNHVNQLRPVQVPYYAIIPYYNSEYPQLLNHHRKKNTTVAGNKTTNAMVLKIAGQVKSFIRRKLGVFFSNF